MKLNYKRTFLVGLAFFSICAFWQMYDGIIPLILRDTYGLDNKLRGIVMGIDNMLALFLLPLFGALSDKKGRRMPFIVIGTALAVVLTMLLAYIIRHYNAAAPTESFCYSYSAQEFLDRAYDYKLQFFIQGGKLKYCYITISVNVLSWSKRIQFEELH